MQIRSLDNLLSTNRKYEKILRSSQIKVFRWFFLGSPSVPHRPPSVQHISSTQKGVELRGFWCGTEGFLVWNWGGGSEGFLVWNWGGFGVELRVFWCGTEGLCWTEGFLELRDFWGWKGVVQKWNWCVELRGSVWNWGVLKSTKV